MVISTSAFLGQDRHIVPVTPETNKVFKFTLGSIDMYEILVPTCSYRMGTQNIGFGFAIIGERNFLIFEIYKQFLF